MKKILVYDDDQGILSLCRTILERNNFDVATLVKCDNIVEDILEIKPDLILMDLWIPDIGGEEAIAIAKTNSTTEKTPILVFSANNNIEGISKKVNADGFITKPFTIASFVDKINANLR